MLGKIIKSLFPKRQLFVRQNGEVTFISLPSLVQLLLALMLIAICAVAGFSSYQYATLNETIKAKNTQLQQQQQAMAQLEQRYQKKHQILATKLENVEKESELMGEMLNSLPEAQAVKAAQKEQQTTTKDNLKADTEDSAKPSTNSTSEETIDIAQQQINHQFQLLKHVIQTRKLALTNAIIQSGLDQKQFMKNENSTIAQGGPLHEFHSQHFTEQQETLIDSLISLKSLSHDLAQLPTVLPAKDFYVSSSYGYRKDPITKRKALHKGIDMAGWHKTKIYAPSHGIVSKAGRNGGYGNFIELRHDNGFITRYGHLAKIKVKRGDKINKNDIIGLMGSSGRSTSTHLHYEILHNGKHINPLKLTRAFENVL